MTDSANCLVIIIAKDDSDLATVQFEIKLFSISITGLHSSLIAFVRTYRPTVSYRDALNRLHVHLNIILCKTCFYQSSNLNGALEVVSVLMCYRILVYLVPCLSLQRLFAQLLVCNSETLKLFRSR